MTARHRPAPDGRSQAAQLREAVQALRDGQALVWPASRSLAYYVGRQLRRKVRTAKTEKGELLVW